MDIDETPEPDIDTAPLTEDEIDVVARALVAAERDDGTEVDVQDLVSDGPDTGDDAEHSYVVRPGQSEASAFEIAYDPDMTFRLDLITDITEATVGLNTDIETTHADVDVTHTESLDSDGRVSAETTIAPIYPGPTDITYQVTQEQIGAHVAQINLSNPGDTLSFEFGSDVTGNLHLLTEEITNASATTDESSVERTMYLIQTDTDVDNLTEEEAYAILAQDGSEGTGMTLLAEIYLGEDMVSSSGNDVTIRDFMNEYPSIDTNIDWTSEAVRIEGTNTTGTLGGSPVITSTPTDIEEEDGGIDDPLDLPDIEDILNNLDLPVLPAPVALSA
jgi:hypothetical protein